MYVTVRISTYVFKNILIGNVALAAIRHIPVSVVAAE